MTAIKRRSTHIDVSKRKAPTKKRSYNVAFSIETDRDFGKKACSISRQRLDQRQELFRLQSQLEQTKLDIKRPPLDGPGLGEQPMTDAGFASEGKGLPKAAASSSDP